MDDCYLDEVFAWCVEVLRLAMDEPRSLSTLEREIFGRLANLATTHTWNATANTFIELLDEIEGG
jgi:hypothetical protein